MAASASSCPVGEEKVGHSEPSVGQNEKRDTEFTAVVSWC